MNGAFLLKMKQRIFIKLNYKLNEQAATYSPSAAVR
jgi:hypothetical protein